MRLGGLTEVADVLGVSTQRAATLRQRPDFPDPVGEIAQGPIWDLDVVAGWNNSGLRQTKAGRPKSEVRTRTLGGRFLLEPDPIGGGGFADVFRATDRKTGELVAVKVLGKPWRLIRRRSSASGASFGSSKRSITRTSSR